MTGIASLTEMLERAAASGAGVRFIEASGDRLLSYHELCVRARRGAHALATAGLGRGDRVGLILRTSPTFYDAFFATLFIGAVPVPLYPPQTFAEVDAYQQRVAHCLRQAQCRAIVTEALFRDVLGRAQPIHTLPIICLDELPASEIEPRPAAPDDVALIQFSSGTTGLQRGVRLTHRQILANIAALRRLILDALPEDEQSHGGACWLPLYHDMGLIGCVLTSMSHAAPLALIPPERFLAEPAVWLRTISRWRLTISPAPNFAFGYCADRVCERDLEGLDLSCWKLALNGAEAVTEEVVQRFAARLAPVGFDPAALTPVYGLAEAGLIVTASRIGQRPRFEHFDRAALRDEGRARTTPSADALTLASVGSPVAGAAVSIRDATGSELADGLLGAVHIQGDSVSDGYVGEPARGDRWLDTGDSGFIHDGELFIFGRRKDVMIIRGRNCGPEELERAAWDVPGVRTGRSAAFALANPRTGTEEIMLVVERSRSATQSSEDIARAVAVRVREATGLSPRQVLVWPAGTLPRTSNGKIRRGETRERYLELCKPQSKVTI